MHLDTLEQLSAWLAATDIALLELRGPGVHVRLRRDGALGVPMLDAAPPDAGTAGRPPRFLAAASSVGVFLHAHPLNDALLAQPGAAVSAGQVLGLLQIGALLLPVTAPQDGTVIGTLVAHGERVGFGTPLVELALGPDPIDEGP